MTNPKSALRAALFAFVLAMTGCTSCGDDLNNEHIEDGGVDMPIPDFGDAEPDAGPVPDADDRPDTDPPNGDMFVFDLGTPDAEDTGPVVLRIDAVLPPRGPVEGGTPVIVQGTGFTPDTVVYFGGRQAQVELIDGDLVGQSPPGQGPGPVNVKVLDPTMGEVNLDGGYEYTLSLAIDSVVPGRVPTEGGVEVSVRGRGFDQQTRVSFGGATGVRHELVDETLMRVIVPPHGPGIFDVRATNIDASAALFGGIEFFEAVRIDDVRPASGVAAGGDTVTLNGAGFDSNMVVEFGGVAATVDSVSMAGDAATVTTPPHAAGLVDVRAENPDGEAFIAHDAFYYATGAGAFAIGGVTPDEGAAIGGTEVTIIGAGLDAVGLTVTFDGVAATIVDQGPGHVVVQTPAHAVGSVDVTIDDGANTDTLPDGFTYVENLWIDRLTPDTGNVAGGYDVVIEGEGFTGATAVEFDGIDAAFTVDTDTQITATAPAHSAALVDVAVERDQVRANFRDAFTYTEPLEIHGFTPVRGSVAGGTYVEIRGRGFVGSPSVTFDGTAATNIQVLDPQTLAVRAPPHATGPVDIEVGVGADTALAPLPYTYYNPGSRFGGAWGGPVAGSVNVTVYSSDGQPLEGAFVMLSTNPGTPYQGLTDVNGMVTLSGPDVFGEQTVTATYNMYIEARPCNPEISWTSSATVQAVDAENITLFLSLDPPPPMGGTPPPEAGCTEGEFECYCRASDPLCDDDLQCNPFTGVCCPPPPEQQQEPTATYTGYLSGLDKLAEPGPTEFQMAIVYTTQTDAFIPNPPPGDGNVVLTNGNYTLTSRIGDLALIAVGGLYDNATQTFRPLMMGVERYLFASDGETYTVDLDLNIPLDTALSFKLNHVPNYSGGPDINRVVPYLDLGFEGVFGGIDVAEGTGDVVTANHQAALIGVFDDAQYFAMGGAYLGQGLPLTVGIKRGITDTDKVIDMPGLAGIANVTSPQPGGVPVSGLVEFDLEAPNEPDFYYVNIAVPTLAGLKTLWEAFLPGDARSLRLPDFPSFAQLPQTQQPTPYPPGTYLLDIIGVQKPGFQWQSFSYNDLTFGDWTAYSYSRMQISF